MLSVSVQAPDDPIRPTGDPIRPTADPIRPTADPIRPTGHPIRPTGRPIRPTGNPIRPTGDPNSHTNFWSMKRLGSLLLPHPPGGCYTCLSQGFPPVHIYAPG